jgi:hypothetical protein
MRWDLLIPVASIVAIALEIEPMMNAYLVVDSDELVSR